jgi:proteasome lid subunit RPN8/RPN11
LISLNLKTELPPRVALDNLPASLERVERDATRLMADLAALLGEARRRTLLIPSDLLFHAVDSLLPPERMAVAAGRLVGGRLVLGAMYDVTGRAHRAHVRADPAKLSRALMAYERSGAALACWLHSHPGSGPASTTPSATDRDQYADWIRDYGRALVGVIVVEDGFVRLWGEGIESGAIRVEVAGDGVRAVSGGSHVYRVVR